MRKRSVKIVSLIAFISLVFIGGYLVNEKVLKDDKVAVNYNGKTDKKDMSKKTARIVANGDILLHDVIYMSAEQTDGSYNFDPYFKYVKPWIEGADLAIGDFEGTISDKHPLSGYPLFNAPKEVAESLKNMGYDVMSLAHNHVLDTGIYGLKHTKKTFEDLGIDVFGVYSNKNENKNILVKEVNGIKIAILGYSYGYNGIEANLSAEERETHLSELKDEKIKSDIDKAKQEADVVVIVPQMGEEYKIIPTEEQRKMYHNMIEWGADVVLGGHPHVPEPTEIVEKNGEKKLIVYSMGNFISNQIAERMISLGVSTGKWTERGILMDLTFEKENGKTTIKNAIAHPTITRAVPNGRKSKTGYPLYDYSVVIVEDFLEGGKYRNELDVKEKEKMDIVYKETKDHMNLNW